MNTTDEGFSLSFHKNYKLDPTYPRHAIFSLRELHQTSPSALRAETSSRYQSDPPENQIWHTDEAGASLACYQSTLISGTSFFSQWYFPSSRRSTNENLKGMVASSPFAGPSRLRRSLARSRAARFALPNRRACSQASYFHIWSCHVFAQKLMPTLYFIGVYIIILMEFTIFMISSTWWFHSKDPPADATVVILRKTMRNLRKQW